MKTAIHLGSEVASLFIPETNERYRPVLTIYQHVCVLEEGVIPASTVSIDGMEQLSKLRDFLNKHIKD